MNKDASTEHVTDHLYDGIEEYDNPLPGWWSWLFVASIVFSIFYWFYYQSGVPGRSVQAQYDVAVADNLRVQFAEIGELKPDEATLVKYMNDEKWKTVGQVVYKANCISCHGANGEGNVGPNLTDDRFKNVRKIEDIATVIREGANNGAMPSWKNRLHVNEVVLTAAYIASMRGSPVAGKTPEGNEIPPWPVSPISTNTAPVGSTSTPTPAK
jgi:cytochrome c oxidase cbb3-type subunit III